MPLLLLTLFAFLGSVPVAACSCRGPQSVAKDYAESTSVFRALTLSRQTIAQDGEEFYLYELGVIAVYKGQQNKLAKVMTATDDGRCGLILELNRQYLIWAHEDKVSPHLSFHSCGRTQAVSAATDDLRWLESRK